MVSPPAALGVHNRNVLQKGIHVQSLSTPLNPSITSTSKAIKLELMTSLPDDWEFQLPSSSSQVSSSVAGSQPEYSFSHDPLSYAPPTTTSPRNSIVPLGAPSPNVVDLASPVLTSSTDAVTPRAMVPSCAVDAHAALELATHNIRVDIQKTLGQKKATDATYARHVKSYFAYWPVFQQTCIQNGQATLPAEPITVPRVAVFLKHEVERKRRKAFTGEEIDNSSIGDKTVEQIINALEDFRKKNQHRQEYYNCPEAKISLRSDPRIKIFEKQARAERPQRVEDAHEMKAHGMTEATYKDDELIRISMRPIRAFENDATLQSMTPQKLATALRDREMILLSCSTAFRGDSSRILQLSDLELYQLRLIDQGYDVRAPCAIFIANQGKTNTDGNLERHGCIRHRIPELCCIGGLAFHFFGEFHLLARPAPDFSVEPNYGTFGRRKWYGLHLFRGGNSDYEPLSYDTHLKRTKAIHDEAGLKLKNVTHAGRHYVGETAMYAGASHDGITKLGQWKTMNAGSAPRYMQSLPVDAILAMGGWNGGNHNSYNLQRGKIDVPASLAGVIFPWIEIKYKELEAQKDAFGPVRGDDHRLRLFLELLKFLRTVILQDAAVLFFKYPQCPLWQHAPFNGSPFHSFALEARKVLEDAALQSQVKLNKLPQEIANMFHGAMGTYNTETALLRAHIKHLEETVQVISENVAIQAGKRVREDIGLDKPKKRTKNSIQRMSLLDTRPTISSQSESPAQPPNIHPTLASLDGSPSPQSVNTTADSTDTVSRSGEIYSSKIFSLSTKDCRTSNAQLDHLLVLESLYEPCRLRKHVFIWSEPEKLWIPEYEFYLPPNGLTLTIEDIWREFTEGIDGQLSVESIEKTWGSRWRKGQGSVRTELSKRLKIVTLIKQLAVLEGWDASRALAFLKEHYVPTKKYSTAKGFIAALQESKMDDAKTKEKGKIRMGDILDHARRIL